MFQKLLSAMGYEKRAISLENPTTEFTEIFAGGSTDSGQSVTAESALRTSAVFACVNVLSGDVGQLPLDMYQRRADGGREKAVSHYLQPIIRREPFLGLSSARWREQLVASANLYGNGFAEIVRNTRRRVTAIRTINPSIVAIRREGSALYYDIHTSNGIITLEQSSIIHIRAMGYNGDVGLSPITYARQSIGLGLSNDEYGARQFSKAAIPRGVLEYPGPGKIQKTQREQLKKEWEAAYAGIKNAHGTPVLPVGVSYKKIAIDPNDAQWLESMAYRVTDIARIFRVPPHKIGDLTHATFSNIEHQQIEYLTSSLGVWLRRIEDECFIKLLTKAEQDQYFFEHNESALLRGDIDARYDAYAKGISNGILQPNEVRARENLNAVPDGGENYAPVNLATLANLNAGNVGQAGGAQDG
jgi:HK97 family phage portal protein